MWLKDDTGSTFIKQSRTSSIINGKRPRHKTHLARTYDTSHHLYIYSILAALCANRAHPDKPLSSLYILCRACVLLYTILAAHQSEQWSPRRWSNARIILTRPGISERDLSWLTYMLGCHRRDPRIYILCETCRARNICTTRESALWFDQDDDVNHIGAANKI